MPLSRYIKPIYLISILFLHGCGIFGSSTEGSNKNYMYGTASYYGGTDGFENKPMANGKPFHSDNANIAAHPTLPLGTKLKVTNVSNHKVLYVEVTDHMPKHKNRVIDLSKRGAQVLGMLAKGTATVRLKIVSYHEYNANLN